MPFPRPQNNHDRDLRDVTIASINFRETARRCVLTVGNINSDAKKLLTQIKNTPPRNREGFKTRIISLNSC
jgi:hypothetical protein